MRSTVARLLTIGLICVAVGVSEVALSKAAPSKPDSCEEVRQALVAYDKIKVGTTREVVEKDFEREGGFQSGGQTRYWYRRCNYIKLIVHYKTPNSDTVEFLPSDAVTKKSRLYLGYPVLD